MDEVSLKVKEARINEVGRGMARLDPEVFRRMGLLSGDVLLLEGKRRAAAIVWQGPDEDEGKNIIRLDGILRHNAGVSLDEEVKVTKTECNEAKEIKFAPSQQIEFSEDFPAFVRERIMNMPLLKGNSIVIDVMGSHLPLTIINVKPSGVVRVTPETKINISKKPVKAARLVPGIRYEDIGGLKDEIETIREMIETPIRHPEVFKRLGVKPPKGVLLYGPPGCGKTLLAKAVANETEANFIPLNGPEIMSKYYGQSEENLREIFKQAQENTPSIIFIDEIDAIAPSREEVTGEVEKRIVSQLLTLMDGLESRGEIVVIAATNRPDAVDPALRRPGRFDREIEIGVPDRDGRKEILQIHTRGMPLTDDVDLDRLADITYGYTGADIESLTKEAAMRALKRVMPEIKKAKGEHLSKDVIDKIKVTGEDFHEAMTRVEPSAMREVHVEIPRIGWNDIGGLESVKQQLRESIEWPIKYPDLFKKTGVRPPKGVLLYGPLGCGKTLLAKAVARESGVNFIGIKGPELLNKYVGESERSIRKVFNRARQVAPSIIFFDELDSLVPKRGRDFGSDVTEKVVAQLLAEIDGVSELRDVMVIGSTNRPDLVDEALMRPGRLDKIIYVPYPDSESRREIFEVHTRNMNLDKDVKIDELVKSTEYYTGADIAAVCREAGMNAIREAINENRKNPDAKKVSMKHFRDALKQVKPSYTEEDSKYWQRMVEKIGERG
ncbi:MAG: AAA family ATPase [Deltaproteobacteria bacterium]|nr:MAG: AAA family ATPase [Deltaproteobacteria bacterium]